MTKSQAAAYIRELNAKATRLSDDDRLTAPQRETYTNAVRELERVRRGDTDADPQAAQVAFDAASAELQP